MENLTLMMVMVRYQIYDALSEGAFHDNKKSVGHGHAYYSYKPNKAIEIFAEYFQMRVQNNTETLNMLQYTHPELSKALASMYSKVACKLRDGEWYDFKY